MIESTEQFLKVSTEEFLKKSLMEFRKNLCEIIFEKKIIGKIKKMIFLKNSRRFSKRVLKRLFEGFPWEISNGIHQAILEVCFERSSKAVL